MQRSRLIRYGLLCGIIQTADANRRHYRMATTWVPHLVMNSITLLLPELYRGVTRGFAGKPDQPQSGTKETATGWRTIPITLETMVCENPRYAAYVAPFALGYLTSHPRFNIYKGAWAEKEFAGLGPDALPHITTAFALTALVRDTLGVAARVAQGRRAPSRFLRWSGRHRVALSAAVLGLATVAWEAGEYRIYRHELTQQGSREAINMQWSRRDMIQDCAANAIGWLLAIVAGG